jgi:hypothetical protein
MSGFAACRSVDGREVLRSDVGALESASEVSLELTAAADHQSEGVVCEELATIVRTGTTVSLVDDHGLPVVADLSSPPSHRQNTHNQAHQHISYVEGQQQVATELIEKSGTALQNRRDSVLLSWFSVTGPIVKIRLSPGAFAIALKLNHTAYSEYDNSKSS